MVEDIEGIELALGCLLAVSRQQRVLYRVYEYKLCPDCAWLVLNTYTQASIRKVSTILINSRQSIVSGMHEEAFWIE